MEYNFRTDIEGYEADEMIRRVQEDPYQPCTDIDGKYKDACYYELPRWWERIYESDFQKLGTLCQGIDEVDLQRVCFRGIGANAVLATNHNLEGTIEKCKLMPSKEGHDYCRIEASWAFNSIEEYAHLATPVCEDLEDGIRALCVGGESNER